MIAWVDEACAAGARESRACEVLAISPRTVQRWRVNGQVRADGRKLAGARRVPANTLTEHQRRQILDIANASEFAHLPPSQIVPTLADQGRYVASESSFYRVLRQANQLAHRGKAKPATRQRPSPLQATAPNQLWSWDITYLATTVKGLFFYLYLIMDVFSRKIVGWEVHESESAEQAAEVFHKTYRREGIAGDDVVLHSDNGSPMKGATMLAMLQMLGVVPSLIKSKPPALLGDSQSLTIPGIIVYHPIYEPPKVQKMRKHTMNTPKSLTHTKWECKYHLVWIPKYRRKTIYKELRQYLGSLLKELASQKECAIEEGHLMADHVHIMISIPPKYSVSQIVGFIKGKSAISIARTYFGRRKNFTGQSFWARGYYVTTVGRDEETVRNYIKHQEAEDRRIDPLDLF